MYKWWNLINRLETVFIYVSSANPVDIEFRQVAESIKIMEAVQTLGILKNNKNPSLKIKTVKYLYWTSKYPLKAKYQREINSFQLRFDLMEDLFKIQKKH